MMKSIIKFGGYEPHEITEYSVEVSDVDAAGSGRSESGVMNRDRVRGGDDPVYKVSVGCTNLTDKDMTDFLNAIKPESVEVVFFFGGYFTKEMYAGNKKAEMKIVDGNETRWNVSVSLTGY